MFYINYIQYETIVSAEIATRMQPNSDYSNYNYKQILQGAPIKNNPLGEIRYLWNCSKFCRQIYTVYKGGLNPHILQISLRNFAAFKNYNYLNLNVHFSK